MSHFKRWRPDAIFHFWVYLFDRKFFFFFYFKLYQGFLWSKTIRLRVYNNRHVYSEVHLQFGIVEHDALGDENVTVRNVLFDLKRLEFL